MVLFNLRPSDLTSFGFKVIYFLSIIINIVLYNISGQTALTVILYWPSLKWHDGPNLARVLAPM